MQVCIRLTIIYEKNYFTYFIKRFSLDDTILIQMLNSVTHSIKYKRKEKYQKALYSRLTQKRARLIFRRSPQLVFCDQNLTKKTKTEKTLELIESQNLN